MSNKFDELAKIMAQSVNRRQALRRLGTAMAAALLASLGLQPKAWGAKACASNADCGSNHICCSGSCVSPGDNNNCGGCGIVCPPGTTCRLVTIRPTPVSPGWSYYVCG